MSSWNGETWGRQGGASAGTASASTRPPRWLHLPGREYRGDASDSFLIRDEAVGYFEGYAAEKPRQRRGCAEVDGLYFVGLHWLHKRKSAVLVGVAEDAEHRAVRLSASHR